MGMPQDLGKVLKTAPKRFYRANAKPFFKCLEMLNI